MNQLLTNLTSALQNPHISVPLIAGVGLEIAGIWFPNYKPQFTETQKALLALSTIGAAASGPTPPKPA